MRKSEERARRSPRCACFAALFSTDFYDAAAPAWHPDAGVFQLRTNRNPRATLLEKETGELSRTGQEYWGYFQQSVEVNPDNHGLISYEKLVEQKAPSPIIRENLSILERYMLNVHEYPIPCIFHDTHRASFGCIFEPLILKKIKELY